MAMSRGADRGVCLSWSGTIGMVHDTLKSSASCRIQGTFPAKNNVSRVQPPFSSTRTPARMIESRRVITIALSFPPDPSRRKRSTSNERLTDKSQTSKSIITRPASSLAFYRDLLPFCPYSPRPTLVARCAKQPWASELSPGRRQLPASPPPHGPAPSAAAGGTAPRLAPQEHPFPLEDPSGRLAPQRKPAPPVASSSFRRVGGDFPPQGRPANPAPFRP